MPTLRDLSPRNSRSLLAIVALVAIGLGTAMEMGNRRARDRWAEREARARKASDQHDRWRDECLKNEGMLPYIPEDRWRSVPGNVGFQGTIKTWSDEAEYHRGIAIERRKLATEAAENKLRFHRRLLIP